MKLLIQNGDLIFDNIEFSTSMNKSDFLSLETAGEIIRRVSNEQWESYSFLYALEEQKPYALLLSFYEGCLKNVSFGIGHPNSTWDDETPERIEEDYQRLRTILHDLFGDYNEQHTFSWGKVELSRDFKNAYAASIVILYGE